MVDESHPGHKVFISDIHSHVPNLQTFFECLRGFILDSVYCAGDIIHNGEHYDANRAIDIFKQQSVKGVRGNHDRIEGKTAKKLRLDNREYLESLPEEDVIDDILIFHTSVCLHNTRLNTDELREQEAAYISEQYPDISLAVYGHSHKPHIMVYDRDKSKGRALHHFKTVQLDPQKLYLLNPGTLGERYNHDHTVAVMDTKNNTLRIHDLDDLVKLQATRRLLMSFEESWMSHFIGDEWSWKKFASENLVEIAKAYSIFPKVVSVVKSLNFTGGKSQKNEFYSKFSKGLSAAIDEVVDTVVFDYFDVRSASSVRDYFLSDEGKESLKISRGGSSIN